MRLSRRAVAREMQHAACAPCHVVQYTSRSIHPIHPSTHAARSAPLVPCDSLDMGRPIASGPVKCGCDEAGRKLLAAAYASIQATCAVQNTTQACERSKVRNTSHATRRYWRNKDTRRKHSPQGCSHSHSPRRTRRMCCSPFGTTTVRSRARARAARFLL